MAALAARPGLAGAGALPGHRRGEYRPRQAGRDAGRDRGGGGAGARARVYPRRPEWRFRDPGGAGWDEAVGRAEAARGDRARAHQEPRCAAARRGDVSLGLQKRKGRAGRPRRHSQAATEHVHHHRAPPLDDPIRRTDRGGERRGARSGLERDPPSAHSAASLLRASSPTSARRLSSGARTRICWPSAPVASSMPSPRSTKSRAERTRSPPPPGRQRRRQPRRRHSRRARRRRRS